MEAILLAGGLGTRLRSVVQDRPKPMALIQGKPFMEYVIRELLRQGVTDVIFAVGYKGSMVEEYFGDGSSFGIRARYAYEETLLGTAGAIKNGAAQMRGEQALVLNADTFYRLDYRRLEAVKRQLRLDMALVLRQVPDVSRYGRAVLKDGMLTAFNEKTSEPAPGTINGGVYLLEKRLIQEIPEGKVSLELEMIPRWLGEHRRLGGFVNDGYFIDIGIPEDYFRFEKDVEKGVLAW